MNLNLPILVRNALDLRPYQFQGPSGQYDERFNVTAKIPEGATKEQFRQMQQNLLIERFGLKFHREKKELSVYAVTVGGTASNGLDYATLPNEITIKAGEQFALDLGWDGTVTGFGELASRLCYPVFTVTRGSRGSLTLAAGELLDVPVFPVDVVDTTGAGDVFHGGYLFGLLNGWPLLRTITFASALAALACTRIGGRAGIPDGRVRLAGVQGEVNQSQIHGASGR